MDNSTTESVITGLTPILNIIPDMGMNQINSPVLIAGIPTTISQPISSISSSTISDTSTDESFISKHKRALMWGGVVIVAIVVIKYV